MKRYKDYKTGMKCHVDGCLMPAEYEAYLYDYYEELSEEFFEQDFTCPFLCEVHMKQNEREMRGVRQPRGIAVYPYTNKYRAQGYTKYAPISSIFPELYAAKNLAEGRNLISSIVAVNDELVAYIAKHPELMYELHPRRFEELVAELIRRKGFVPQLTPASRDGGFDIIATRSDPFGELLYLIECKRYAPHRKVGVQQVRGIYGVAEAKKATRGILVTTSSFTNDAVKFATPLKYALALNDFDDLQTWLNSSS